MQSLLIDKELEIMHIVRPQECVVIYQYNFGDAIVPKKVKAKIQIRNSFIVSKKAKLLRDLI